MTTSENNIPTLRFSEFEGLWTGKPLQKYQADIYEITYGILKPEKYIAGGIPMLQIKDIIANVVNTSDLHLISNKLQNQYKRTILDENNIVISVVGTIGRIAKIPKVLKGANIHRNLALLKIKNTVSHDFVFQRLLSTEIQNEISKK